MAIAPSDLLLRRVLYDSCRNYAAHLAIVEVGPLVQAYRKMLETDTENEQVSA